MPKTPEKKPGRVLTRKEIFSKLNVASEKMLDSLQKAYLAGIKEGINDQDEDDAIKLLEKVKTLRDKIRKMTTDASRRGANEKSSNSS